MNTAYLSLGSNIEPAANMVRAVEMLTEATTVIALSTVWECPPVGLIDQANFLNAAAIIQTNLSANKLKTTILRRIERGLGRVWQADKNAPRPMDIDIMLFNQDILQLDNRQIPDDEILSRPFVAIPLAELAPDYRHPQTKQTLQEIAAQFNPVTEGMERHHDASQAVQTVIRKQSMKTRINADTNDNYHNSIQIDGSPSARQKNIELAARQILLNIGEEPERDGLKRTPERIARMYDELTAGYTIDPNMLINDALFAVDYNELIVVKEIEFFSLCEHHLLPFFGKAHVGYIPNGQVLGLSKIPRIVEMFARRLQVQERLTRQIADFLDELLDPQGVAVVVEGMHLCSMMRGVKQSEAKMITQTFKGLCQNESAVRQDFMMHVRRGDDSG